MMSRSLKASSSSMRPRTRPQLGSRTSSASSITSQRSQPDSNLPRSPSVPTYTSAGYFTAAAATASSSVPKHFVTSPSERLSPGPVNRGVIPESPQVNRSHPIRITLPPRRSGPIETPPEPLSARGDLLGGYFPLHEDFQRSYKPHPFHHRRDASKDNNPPPASPGSVNSDDSISPLPLPEADDSPLYSPRSPLSHPATLLVPTTDTLRPPSTLAMPSPFSPLPLAIPMGKYHPSNYKNKNKEISPSLLEPVAAPTSSPATTSTHSHNSTHKRQTSDVRKKLQQYQRDMVEQAALAARMQVPGVKPDSPRLLPLGSPGPVTPMELEESAGYLFAGSATSAGLTEDEILGELIKSETTRAESSSSTVTVSSVKRTSS